MKNALLISVGGSPAPIIHSINCQQPDYLVFFVSAASRDTVVSQILPALERAPRDREFITTDNEQDLEQCVGELMRRLPKVLKIWNVGFGELAVDFTGGTKAMSAAVVLTLARRVSGFSYVGGAVRDKQGLGVVIDGREQMLFQKNPWNELSVELLDDMALLFNRCRFQSAVDLAEQAARRTPAKKELFDGLKAAADGYYAWDNFQYDRALPELRKAESRLRAICNATSSERLRTFHRELADNVNLLSDVVDEVNFLVKSAPKGKGAEAAVPLTGMAIIRDLVANAVRRAEVEFKYEDAVARLYSAIEKTAKMRLKVAHGIDNSNVLSEQIPAGCFRDALLQECANQREGGKIQLPLHKSFELLQQLGDETGAAYADRQEELSKVLTIRNMSLLAHGFDPVRKETYEKMLGIALSFLALEKDVLPRFPVMDWDGAGI